MLSQQIVQVEILITPIIPIPEVEVTLEGIEVDGTLTEAEEGIQEEDFVEDVPMTIIAIVILTLTLLRL
jgi:hypothetical protein